MITLQSLKPFTAPALAAVFGLAMSLSPTAHAAVVQVGPGADLAGATSGDTAGTDRLNVSQTTFELKAGTYDVLDFQLNVKDHTNGIAGAGEITPMLLTGAPSNYTTLWVGDAFDPTSNGVQTAASYTPGSETFTLGSASSVFAGFFTENQGSRVIQYANGVGLTSHDNSFSGPTGSGQNVSGFSNANLPRSYAFEVNIDAGPFQIVPDVVVNNGNSSASNTDLLQSHLASVVNSGVGVTSGDGPQGGEPVLHDGSTPSNNSTGYATSSTETTRISDGNVLTYYLDTSSNEGFAIERIDIFHGWRDNGRDALNDFDVHFEFMSNPGTFVKILDAGASGDYAANYGSVSVVAGGPLEDIARFVSAVRITFNDIKNGYGGFGEIDVIGSAIPTPAALPAGLALLGLAAMRRRGRA